MSITHADMPQEATQYEITQAINKHVFAFDADDCQTIVGENFEDINNALKDGDPLDVGQIIQIARRQLIADRASIAVYGRVGVITADMVNV